MDCPSEEQLIRMKLEGVSEVKQLHFDIPNRKLEVVHTGDVFRAKEGLGQLELGSILLTTEKFEGDLNNKDAETETRVLWWVLGINFGFFLLEMLYGVISSSMGLVADSLDMLADSFVYSLSLIAVGSTAIKKKKVAKLSGYIQMVLAGIGLFEVLRRFIDDEGLPLFQNMIVVSILALAANAFSLYLIQKLKSNEAHIKASAIFTSNDIVINAGVILAGCLVYLTESTYPDLVIGSIIFFIVIRGAFRILKLSQ